MSDDAKPIPFDGFFPLPFRVFCLMGLGMLGWATNLHVLDRSGVNFIDALELQTPEPTTTSPLSRRHSNNNAHKPSNLYSPVYRLFFTYSLWCFGAWALYIYVIHGNVMLVDAFRHIPAICGLFILIALVGHFEIFQKRERDLFLFALWRCLFSALDEPIYFSDVVFADILTSFAKVLGDMWLSLCMLLPGGSLLSFPPQEGWSRWILPTIMSLPYLVRFRQCLIEYSLSRDANRRPLYNAIKYATSFPVIYLSAAQRVVVSEFAEQSIGQVAQESWSNERIWFRLWLLAAMINSFYSFWWDVTNDWGLDLLKKRSPGGKKEKTSFPRHLVLPSLYPDSSLSPRSSKRTSFSEVANLMGSTPGSRSYPYGLRPILLYPLPVYPALLFMNLILRMTWSIKLSSQLYVESYGSAGIFWLEMAEMVRRWMWVFIRVEWEVVKKVQERESRPSKDRGTDNEEFELLDSESREANHEGGNVDLIDVDLKTT